MQQGKIDAVIVGSDRIAANGDVANKIGTYEKAVIAHELGIPFYVAAPTSTIDRSCPSGAAIPIEERGEDEVLYCHGVLDNGEFGRVRLAPPGTRALNLAFDVTPARYITRIITQKGIFRPEEICTL
jgi:methylthioribose-1-phosphate isomerase